MIGEGLDYEKLGTRGRERFGVSRRCGRGKGENVETFWVSGSNTAVQEYVVPRSIPMIGPSSSLNDAMIYLLEG